MASRKKSGNWSIGPGRALLYQGRTVAYVQRVESATTPTEADDLAHTVAAALNATGAGPRATRRPRKTAIQRSQDTLIAGRYKWLAGQKR